MKIDRKQKTTLIAITALLLGLIALPPILQKFYNISAIEVSFAVILVYIIINWWINRN